MDVGPLTVLTVLLAAGAARLGWLVARRPAGPLLSGALAVALLTTGLAGAVEWRHQWVQAAASEAVRELTGDPGAHATCQRFSSDLIDLSQHAGFVSWDDSGTARLRRTVCNDLATWILTGSGVPTERQLIAVHVLTHESMHVAGDHVEASTECSAMQRDAQTARILGADPEVAAAMARTYYLTVYPRMAADYRSAACAEDGALDATPHDGTFP